MYKIVIIDDQEKAKNILINIISEFCTNITIAGIADGVESGIEIINKINPDIVILDVEMNDGTGFDLLSKLTNRNFALVFSTGHNDFAIKAFKYNAIDYVLKPVDPDELILAIEKAKQEVDAKFKNNAIDNLLQTFKAVNNNDKLVLKTSTEINIVKISEIIHCEASGSYTKFITENGNILVSKNLKEYEEILKDHNFFRSHQSHIVNLNYMLKYVKSDGGRLIMKNGSEIPVAVRKKEALLSIIEKM